MNESDVRQSVVKILKPFDAVAIENAVGSGTPDVNYVEGWIEIKWLPEWPKKASTIVKVRKFTPQQRVWIKRRAKLGGRIHLLLRVDKEWLLFEGKWAAFYLGYMTKEEMMQRAIGYWKNRLDPQQFIETLKIGKGDGDKKSSRKVSDFGLKECV